MNFKKQRSIIGAKGKDTKCIPCTSQYRLIYVSNHLGKPEQAPYSYQSIQPWYDGYVAESLHLEGLAQHMAYSVQYGEQS